MLNKLLLAKIITSLSLDAIIATITLLHYSERICKTKEGMVKAMSRLELASPTRADIIMEELYKDLERRIESSPPGLCPVDMARDRKSVV